MYIYVCVSFDHYTMYYLLYIGTTPAIQVSTTRTFTSTIGKRSSQLYTNLSNTLSTATSSTNGATSTFTATLNLQASVTGAQGLTTATVSTSSVSVIKDSPTHLTFSPQVMFLL